MVEKSGYLGLMAKIFIFLIFMVGAIASAYFGIVGLFYSQGIVEVDVIGDRYRYECLTNCDDPDTATYNTSVELTSYEEYVDATASLNSKVGAFLTAISVVFSLLGLYVLMQVVQEIKSKDKGSKRDMY